MVAWTVFYMDISTGECMIADEVVEDSSMLTPEDLEKYDALVREADMLEIKSVVDDKVFKTVPRASAKYTPMSCLWVRKRKRQGSQIATMCPRLPRPTEATCG